MRIGIIGAGSLGSALGERLGRAGHEIMFGGGDTARDVAGRTAAGVGSNSDAAAFGDVVVLAVPFAAVEPAMMLLIELAYAGAPRDVGLRLLERTAGSGSGR